MRRPEPRGPVSAEILDVVRGPVAPAPQVAAVALSRALELGDAVVEDEDVQLSLTLLYELHHHGLDGADPGWEWSPDVIGARNHLEAPFEAALRRMTWSGVQIGRNGLGPHPTADDVARVLFAMTDSDDGPAVSTYVQREATLDQVRDLLVLRSQYYLQEADPHAWGIARLTGRPKSALVEVLADEYGGGVPGRMHSALFAKAMRSLGLEDVYGAHLDLVPAAQLATLNAISMFGMHMRLRGALAGHLAALEMTSSIPNRRYGNGLRRLGLGEDTTDYFDEHVEADAVHEQVAGRDLAGGLVEQDPTLLDDVLFGAAVALELDAVVGTRILGSWAAGRSPLRTTAGAQAAVASTV